MSDFKAKFQFSLKNAQRILDLMKHTHRNKISQRDDIDENTFESKDDLTLPMVRSVAERLEHKFFIDTLKEYSEHIKQLQNNQDSAMKALEKLTEKYKQLDNMNHQIQNLIKTNQQLDQQIRTWEEEDLGLTRALKEEELLHMVMLQQTQKGIRGIIDSQYTQNWQRVSFTQKWNQYLRELKQQPKLPKRIQASNAKIVKKSSIQDSVQQPKSLKRTTNHDALLGDLKQFSKNLKIPKKKN